MPILDVRDVHKWYPLQNGWTAASTSYLRAVDGVTFTIDRGRVLGLAGESGCGKSTLARVVLRLVKATAGSVSFDGLDVLALPREELRRIRKRMQIIFQDPFSSLNPRLSIGAMLSEILLVHGIAARARDTDARIGALLETVGLNTFHARRYPHEFSSGQRQRIGIARALAVEPEFIVCDEPVSALDVSIQAAIINLLLDLKEKFGLTYLFISHDLHVLRHIADDLAVMYLGRIVEIGPAAAVTTEPLHPYSRALVASMPAPVPGRPVAHTVLHGEAPGAVDIPGGCPFHPRCPEAQPACAFVQPRLATVAEGRLVSCLLYPQCHEAGGIARAESVS
ncbi:MAG: ABC transporter ATP-binding protein [Ignavibacteriae bacterium]|nr:ABC transporter ATP-binding protein [Ignavibacteriota bacterium]